MARAPVGAPLVLAPHGASYRSGRVGTFLDRRTGINTGQFARSYRGIQRGHDELVPTSAVRGLIQGMRSAGALPRAKVSELAGTLESISAVRFATSWSGHSVTQSVMQHPTRAGSGLFGNPRRTARMHSRLDLERKEQVAGAMERGIAVRAGAGEAGALAVMRAVEYTANAFTGPVLAGNMRPGRRLGPSEGDLQTAHRETAIKARYAEAGAQFANSPAVRAESSGAPAAAARQSATAHWTPGNRRGISPPRR